MSAAFRIKSVRTSTIAPAANAGAYFKQEPNAKHWLVDSLIANPMSGHDRYRAKRSSWGIGTIGSFVIEIITEDGTIGIASGTGGEPACWLIKHHFSRFLIGEDARNINLIWDEMYRASLPYGRKGLPIMAISAVDLALWDLVGKIRNEPVYHLIGGLSREEITFYCTTPEPAAIKSLGFWGAKIPLPHSHFEGRDGLKKNIAVLERHRAEIGRDYPLMVDCYMSLTVPYAIELAEACKHLDIYWWEEVLSPDDTEGYRAIRAAHPTLRWTTGEHEYTRYGFRKMISERLVDIVQPDVMWVGGLTELLRIAALASAYDVMVVPHGSGPYSYHFIASQAGPAFCEYVAASPDGKSIAPVFGALFDGEDVPLNGKLKLSLRPGFGMVLKDHSILKEFQ